MTDAGTSFWRGLEDLEPGPAGVGARAHAGAASVQDVALQRRDFLRLMAASMSLAGVGACSRAPEQTIVPYVRRPSQMTAGDPLYFATAAAVATEAVGVL